MSFPSPSKGAAYVFVRSGRAWSEQAKLTASDGGPYEGFGESVALFGSTAVGGRAIQELPHWGGLRVRAIGDDLVEQAELGQPQPGE